MGRAHVAKLNSDWMNLFLVAVVNTVIQKLSQELPEKLHDLGIERIFVSDLSRLRKPKRYVLPADTFCEKKKKMKTE